MTRSKPTPPNILSILVIVDTPRSAEDLKAYSMKTKQMQLENITQSWIEVKSNEIKEKREIRLFEAHSKYTPRYIFPIYKFQYRMEDIYLNKRCSQRRPIYISKISENICFVNDRYTRVIHTMSTGVVHTIWNSFSETPWELLEIVDSFCYLRDVINKGTGCIKSILIKVRMCWIKFREQTKLQTAKPFPTKWKMDCMMFM